MFGFAQLNRLHSYSCLLQFKIQCLDDKTKNVFKIYFPSICCWERILD